MSETQTSLKFKDRLKAIRKPFNQEMLDKFFSILEMNQANDDGYDPKSHTQEQEAQYEKVTEELERQWNDLSDSIGKNITPDQILEFKKKQWRKQEETAFNYLHKEGLPESSQLMDDLKATAQLLLEAYTRNSSSDSQLAQNYFSAHSEPEEDYDLVSIKNKTVLEQRWVNLEKVLGKIYSLEEALSYEQPMLASDIKPVVQEYKDLDDHATKQFFNLMKEEADIDISYTREPEKYAQGKELFNKIEEKWLDLETLAGRKVTQDEIWINMETIWINEENKEFNSKFNSPSFNKLQKEDQEYAIMSAFSQASYSDPESLYRDGEATRVDYQETVTKSEQHWKNLEAKIGKKVTYEKVFEWEVAEQAKEEMRKQAELTAKQTLKVTETVGKVVEPVVEIETKIFDKVIVEQPTISDTSIEPVTQNEVLKEKPVKKATTKKEEVKEIVVVTPTTPEGKKKYLGFSLRRN